MIGNMLSLLKMPLFKTVLEIAGTCDLTRGTSELAGNAQTGSRQLYDEIRLDRMIILVAYKDHQIICIFQNFI